MHRESYTWRCNSCYAKLKIFGVAVKLHCEVQTLAASSRHVAPLKHTDADSIVSQSERLRLTACGASSLLLLCECALVWMQSSALLLLARLARQHRKDWWGRA